MLAATTLAATPTLAATSTSTSHPINLGIGTSYQYAVNAVNEPADTAKLHSMGISYLREGIYWNTVQPTSTNQWNWSSYDAMFARAAAQHDRILPIVSYGTSWATPGGNLWALPETVSARNAFAAFARAVVHRYGSGGTFWRTYQGNKYPIQAIELWNEPWYLGASSAYNYALLLHDAAHAVHQADASIIALANVDDRNVEDSAGQWVPWGYLVLRQKRLLTEIGGWAEHPYPSAAVYTHQTPLVNSVEQVNWLRSLLARRHYSGRIWITEIGFSDRPNSTEPNATAASAVSNYDGLLRQLARMSGPYAPQQVFAFTAARATVGETKATSLFGYNLFSSDGSASSALKAVAATAQATQ